VQALELGEAGYLESIVLIAYRSVVGAVDAVDVVEY